jgi:hypothetical protein
VLNGSGERGVPIAVDFGTVYYDRDASNWLLAEMTRQRDAAVVAKPPDFEQVVILSNLVGWMRHALQKLWPDEEEQRPSPGPRLVEPDEPWTEPGGAP